MRKGLIVNPKVNIEGINYKDIVEVLAKDDKILGKTLSEMLKLSENEIPIRKTKRKRSKTGNFIKELIIGKCLICDLEFLN